MEKILIICGPTATGKTALAAILANRFNGELISADSRQIYKGMDIVTGKERPVGIRTWLYDVVRPDEEFSVSHWLKLANIAISDILKRGKLPIIVGGTGLYIQAILKPPETINIPPNYPLRKKLNNMTKAELQKLVQQGDMNNSDWNNPRRLIRRIEIAQSNCKLDHAVTSYDSLIIGLTAPLTILDEQIDNRLKRRVRGGLLNEIALLRAKYDTNLPSMSAIGINEHAYARRQLTWFKKMPNIHVFDITKPSWRSDVTTKVATWYTKEDL